MHWFTALARPIDLRVGTNRRIAAVSVAGWPVGALQAWLRGDGGLGIVVAGCSLAVTIFLGWALTRELDPDAEASAFVAAGLAAAGWFALGESDLWAAGVALLLCRMVARTVGPPALLGDALVVLATITIVTVVSGRWSFAIAGALAFSLDALLVAGQRTRLLFAGLAAGVAVASLSSAAGLDWHAPAHALTIGVVAAVTLGHIASLPHPVSGCDVGEHGLDRQRIRGAVAVALSIVVLSAMDAASGYAAGTVIAALVGAAVGRSLPRRRQTGTTPRAAAVRHRIDVPAPSQ